MKKVQKKYILKILDFFNICCKTFEFIIIFSSLNLLSISIRYKNILLSYIFFVANIFYINNFSDYLKTIIKNKFTYIVIGLIHLIIASIFSVFIYNYFLKSNMYINKM